MSVVAMGKLILRPFVILLAGTLLVAEPLRAQITFQRIDSLGGILNSHAISGDGSRVAFISPTNPTGNNTDGNWEVFLFDVASGSTYQITRTQSQSGYMDHRRISISHDGSRIAFTSSFADDVVSPYRLSDRDVFIADLGSGDPPSVNIQRVTRTGERGAHVISGDGTKLVLVSDNNLEGRNSERHPEIFRITLTPLSPTANAFQQTDTPNGVGDSIWDVAVDINYNGSVVVLTSDQDLIPGGNADGNTEIFLLSNTNLYQATQSPAGVHNRLGALGQGWDIAFVSNGDYSGENSDGNYEIFLHRSRTATQIGNDIIQVTNTTGGDDGFGGANDHVDMTPDSSTFVFRSTRDLVPVTSGGSGNADGNKELFLAEFSESGGVISFDFSQLTNTTTASPGTRFENVYPRLDAVGTHIAFDSDLDLGVPGTSILYLGSRTTTGPVATPQLTGFTPQAGGPGVSVHLIGNNLTGATSVQFGALPALSFDVISSTRIVATVPRNIASGPITVTNPGGTATTTTPFEPATLAVFGSEFSQGVADYPPIVGKDAIVRVFTGSSGPGFVSSYEISDARLDIRVPGATAIGYQIPPTMYSTTISNSTVSRNERNNVNFYLDGDIFDQTGQWQFDVSIWNLGQLVHSESFTRDIVATKDAVMVLQSLLRHPNETEWRMILNGLETASRIFPVRQRIGDLEGAIGGTDFAAGTRIGYLRAPIWEEQADSGNIDCSSNGCISDILTELTDRLTAVNSGGFEATEFSVAYAMPDAHVADNGQIIQDCDVWFDGGVYGDGTLVGISRGGALWSSLCDDGQGVFSHELGHSMGLVPEGAPNLLVSPDDPCECHSANPYLPTHAFNLMDRQNVGTPRSVMVFYGPPELMFLESYSDDGQMLDYPYLVSNRTITSAGSSQRPSSPLVLALAGDNQHPPLLQRLELSQPPQSKPQRHPLSAIVLMGSLDEKRNEVTMRHAFVTKKASKLTPLDKKSDIALAYIDAKGDVLGIEPVKISRRSSASVPKGRLGVAPLSIIRPLPRGTVAVEIRKSKQEEALYVLRPGPELPTIRLEVPKNRRFVTGDRVTLSWQAHDPDGDSLSYDVAYSRDGGKTFEPFIASTQKQKVTFSTAGLPGGKLIFRVRASDGLHMGSVMTPIFEAPQHRPIAAITSLSDGDRIQTGDPLLLRGLAMDLDEGIVWGTGQKKMVKFQWLLNETHVLGYGERLTVSPKLSPGPHTITLKVTDSTGRTGTHTVTILAKGLTRTPIKVLRVPGRLGEKLK